MTFMRKEITAREFADNFNNRSFTVYKILRANLTQHGRTYTFGLNNDPFVSSDAGVEGGMHFFWKPEDVFDFSSQGYLACTFELDPGRSKVYVERDAKAKTDLFTLIKVVTFNDFVSKLTPEIRVDAIQRNRCSIECFTRKGREPLSVRLAAVNFQGEAIQHLCEEEREHIDIRLAAVRNCGLAIRYLTEKEREPLDVRLAAVSQNGLALQYLTENERADINIREAAVRNCAQAIQYLTEEERAPLR